MANINLLNDNGLNGRQHHELKIFPACLMKHFQHNSLIDKNGKLIDNSIMAGKYCIPANVNAI